MRFVGAVGLSSRGAAGVLALLPRTAVVTAEEEVPTTVEAVLARVVLVEAVLEEAVEPFFCNSQGREDSKSGNGSVSLVQPGSMQSREKES